LRTETITFNMRLAKALLLCLFIFALGACDTFHRAILVNATDSTVTVISNEEFNFGNPSLLKLVEETNGQFHHELIANSEYIFAAEIDMPITVETFPCDTLIIIDGDGNDVFRLHSKAEIFAAMNVISEERLELRIGN